MKNNQLSLSSRSSAQTIVSVILIALLLLIWNPWSFWMPTMMLVSVLIALLIAFSLFASFILQEKVADEREGSHRMLAGRAAFLTGSAVLMIGIFVQAFSHAVDIWLVVALVVMIITKIGSRIYSDRNF